MARAKQTARKTTGGRPPKSPGLHSSSSSSKAEILGRPQTVGTSNVAPTNEVPQKPRAAPRTKQTARKSTGGHAPRVELPVAQVSTSTKVSRTTLTAQNVSPGELLKPSHVQMTPSRRLGLTARKSTGGREPPEARERSFQRVVAEVLEHPPTSRTPLNIPVMQRPMLTSSAPAVPPRDLGPSALVSSSLAPPAMPGPGRVRTKQTARKSTGGHAPRMPLGGQT